MPSLVKSKRGAVAPPPPPPKRLKRLNLKVEDSDGHRDPKIPVLHITGDICKRYNEAKAAIKDAEAIVEELEETIRNEALSCIFQHNCVPGAVPVTSVKIRDSYVDPDDDTQEKIPGEATRVSFTRRYGTCDAAAVDAAFGSFPAVSLGGKQVYRDINDYVTETVSAKFDDKVFLDETGNFDIGVYEKFRTAIETCARSLGMIDDETGSVKSPLSTKRVLVVKPDFHQRRFVDFNEDENFALTEVLPNTVQCVPVRTV